MQNKNLLALIGALALSGCVLAPVQKPAPVVRSVVEEPRPVPKPLLEVTEVEQLHFWLETADRIMNSAPEQALEQLKVLETQRATFYDHFRYALLNQQQRDRAGWVRARDTLRWLRNHSELRPQLRWLVTILLDYNQALINAEERRHQMARELEASQQAQRELQQKITALTNLEERISIRKEEAIDADAIDAGDTPDSE